MIRIVTAGLGLLLVLPGRAQTFTEWFKQNSTRLKYYARQVAALQVYAGELEKELQVSDAGLTAISGSKQGEYDLHDGYYASLENINPALGQMPEVAEIRDLQAAIVQRFSTALNRYRSDGVLGADRVASVEQAYSAVLQAGSSDVTALAAVLTPNNWQMTDDQRIARIRELDTAMRQRYAFTLAYTDRADLLELEMATEGGEIGTVNGLYGGQ
jgi:hypothetical protein